MRALLLLLLLGSTDAIAAPDPEQAARSVVQLFLDEKYEGAAARFADRGFGDKVAAMMKQARGETGPAKKLTAAGRAEDNGATRLTYRAEWTRGAPSEIKLWIAPDGKVVAYAMRAAPDESRDAYTPKARLRAPFAGTWTARNARDEESGHARNPNQRFAVDWLITDEAGKTYRGDGKRNADYLCWGKDALAVADGTVVTVVDGVPENEPGAMDTYHVGGNEVVVDLGNGEYALYCHLVPGSIRTKVGQRIKAGDVLGKVGNSGNSSEAHLHFQLSDSPRLHQARSLPARYPDVILDGKPSALAWPTSGQRMAPR